MKNNYENLLKRAREKIPTLIYKTERFEIPKAMGHIQGNKTIITNFIQVCDLLGRKPDHLLKYLQRELATPAQIEKSRLILGRKISLVQIDKKIEQYVSEFVLCSECKKPDTKLTKEERVTIMKCTACGAKHPVKGRI